MQPEAFLKWSMDRYSAMPSYKTEGSVSMSAGVGGGAPQQRQILIQAPNRFKVVSVASSGFVQTSVSDGKSLAEYSTMGQPAMTYASPSSIAKVSSMQMMHPMFCGSLLYQFFGGSSNFGGLVNAQKGPIRFGAEETTEGEKSRVVKFYGQQTYGHVEALIGETTGRVYRIKYDSEPLVREMSSQGMMQQVQAESRALIDKMKPGPEKDAALAAMRSSHGVPTFETTETYTQIVSPAPIASDSFDVKTPEGTKVVDTSAGDKPPVPEGSPAPDFEVATLNGKTVKLSSLRGHPVLIDFWATWCPPCREGLPETNKLSKIPGLQVMAVSDEEGSTISAFMQKNHYTVTPYHDEGDHAQQAYGVSGIPTTVIVDADGKLRSFFVGLHGPKEIEEALSKVGVKAS